MNPSSKTVAAPLAVALFLGVSLLSQEPPHSPSATDCDDPINVRAYGAKGDDHTDDTASINTSLAALPSTGGVVIFPTGTYLISSTVTPSKKVRLFCAGATGLTGSMHGSCRIKKSRNFVGNAIFFGPVAQGSIIEGLEIDGDPGNNGDGIQILANSIALRDVAVVNQGGNGVRIGEDTVRNGTQANSFYLDRVRSASNGGHGFYIHKEDVAGPDWSDANAGTMINCVARLNGGDGFRIGKGINNTFIGLLSEGNRGAGVRLTRGAGAEIFIGGDVNEGNGAGNVLLDSGNALASYFFGTDTGAAVKDSGRPQSVFLNRSYGLAGPIEIGPSQAPIANAPASVARSVVQSGSGQPMAACRSGSLYLRTDGGPGTTLYVCEQGHWAAK